MGGTNLRDGISILDGLMGRAVAKIAEALVPQPHSPVQALQAVGRCPPVPASPPGPCNIAPFPGVTGVIMAKSLIDYYEEVLSKISYADQAVFRKELRKAFRHLVPAEREQLKQWFRSACVCKAVAKQEHGTALRAGNLS